MSLTPLAIPYSNFRLGEIIDPDEFNSNNNAIVNKINTMVSVITTGNTDPGGDGEDIILPSYIKETYIDPVEIRSPLITGNTLLGSNGMVGISSVGTTSTSVRIWAGSTNRDTAPFRVTHGGGVNMTKADIAGIFRTTASNGNETSIIYNSDTYGGRILLNAVGGSTQRNVFIGDSDGLPAVSGGAIILYNKADVANVNNYRVYMGINSNQDAGFLAIRNQAGGGVSTIDLTGDSMQGPHIDISNSQGDQQLRLSGNNHSYFLKPINIGSRFEPGSAKGLTGMFGVEGNSIFSGNVHIYGDIYQNGVKMKLTPA